MAAERRSMSMRDAPPSAGGGRPSRANELYAVASLSQNVREELEAIYKSLSQQRAATAPSSATDQPPVSSFADFEAWFKSSNSSALAPPPHHDLTYPIANYYISSSHNTYLSGNQFYGASTGEAYENVLRRGCRCLEIDVWDGDDDNSSVSSSDLEDDARRQTRHKGEGRRVRANSKLNQLKDRVKEKAGSQAPSDNGRVQRTESDVPEVESLNIDHMKLMSLKSEPRVKHGYTLTKDIPFRTVCNAIKETAFEATELPLIVSLEVHCNFEQQKIMVDILQSVFKDHLVDITGPGESEITTLPSPDALRKKILIKVKWAPNTETGESNNPLDHVHSKESDATEDSANTETKKKAAKILHALSVLGVYTRAYSFKHFDQPEAKIPTHVFSLSEAKVEDIHSDPQHGPALVEHNRNFMMRCYPSGMRVDSSNLEPCFLWRQGAQMVALNWQKLDKGMMLNEGMFSGEEGWVLKPEGLRGKCDKHSTAPSVAPRRHLMNLEIELIAAQNLPLPLDKEEAHAAKMKPYVKIQLHVDTHGPPGQGSDAPSSSDSRAHFMSRYKGDHSHKKADSDSDEEARKLKLKSKTRKTANPDFGHEVLRWSGIHDVVDELSFMRLKVEDDRSFGSDDLIAWTCIKMSRLRNGYRFIHLLDAAGSPSQGLLLVKITKTLT